MVAELIIDAHVHTYRSPEMGQQAMMGRGQSGYSGTIEELLAVMRRAGIGHAVMVNMTPVLLMRIAALERLPATLLAAEMAAAERQQLDDIIGRLVRRNEWTCAIARENPKLLAFVSVVPEMGSQGMLRELESNLARGARGLKLHPADCAFYPDNPALWPVYRRCEELGLPVIAHGGTFQPAVQCSEPRFFVPVLKAFPRLKLVLAHLGRPFFAEVREMAASFPNVCFDTSGAVSAHHSEHSVPPGAEVALIRAIGAGRVLFGSDFPWYDPARDVEFISALPLTDGERRAVMGENAAALFGIEA